MREVQTAAAHGDRSENAEYQYGKKRLREIDSRVRYLQKLIGDATVVEPVQRADPDKAYFGCWVTVEDEEGEEFSYQLVGRDEFDAATGRVSTDSPLGRALLGKRVDDSVTVKRPKGDAEFVIVHVGPHPPDEAQ